MPHLFDWIAAARPKTLGAAIAPVVVGCALAAKISGHFDWWLAFCTLGSCGALQIATNFFNDALDSVKGADTPARIGPRRITASGVDSSGTVNFAAWLMLAVATLLAMPLFEARGLPILFIGIPSLYFCFGYTGGPVADAGGNTTSNPALDVCGKQLTDCKLRFGDDAILPFGGFPGCGLTT